MFRLVCKNEIHLLCVKAEWDSAYTMSALSKTQLIFNRRLAGLKISISGPCKKKQSPRAFVLYKESINLISFYLDTRKVVLVCLSVWSHFSLPTTLCPFALSTHYFFIITTLSFIASMTFASIFSKKSQFHCTVRNM